MSYQGIGLGLGGPPALRFGSHISKARLLLDKVPGAELLLMPSLRLSREIVNSVELRRTSDNDEQEFSPEQWQASDVVTFADGVDARTTKLFDFSGNGNDATQTTAAAQPFAVTGGVLEDGLRFLSNGDAFIEVDVPAGGFQGTIVVATTQGTYAAEIDLPAGVQQLSAKGFSTDRRRSEMLTLVGLGLWGRTLSESEIETVKSVFVKGGAVESFAGVANFFRAWRLCNSLTSFPELDVSDGTNFLNAWNNCTSLKSFPELDVSNGILFNGAWASCNLLTSFPLLDVKNGRSFFVAWDECTSLKNFPAGMWDDWNPLSIFDNCFLNTWRNNNLTATSVENILNSIDASGKHATNTGESGGTPLANSDITIDYDDTTGTPDITGAFNLRQRGWNPILNGVEIYIPEVMDYFARVEDAGGEVLAPNAINTYFQGLVNNGIWDKLGSSCLFAGVDFSGCFVPIRDDMPTPSNTNFDEDDHNVLTGLQGDGATKYIDTNYAQTSANQNNVHASIYNTRADHGGAVFLGNRAGTAISIQILPTTAGANRLRFNYSDLLAFSGSNTEPIGFFGATRGAAANHEWATPTTNDNTTTASTGFSTENFFVFDRAAGNNPTDTRLMTFAIGTDVGQSGLLALRQLQNQLLTNIANELS